MKRLLLLGVVFLWILISVVGQPEGSVSADPAVVQPSADMVVVAEPAPQVTAKAYGVFDVETGELLFGENIEEQRPIASVTKLFTAATVLAATSAPETITVTYADIATEGESGKLRAGQEYKTHELMFPLLLESSNDAAVALGRVVGSVKFADRAFNEPSGLASTNRASVVELGGEARRLYLQVPHIFDITKLQQYVGEKTGWVNNSPVRDLPGFLGGKHGYTEAANRTLVAFFAESSLGNRPLEYVILGSDNVRADVEVLRALVVESVVLQ